VFEAITRDELVKFILDKGGKSPSAVSGKTSFLIAGSKLEDGREACTSGKYKKAVEKDIKILSESDFEEYVQKITGLKGFILGARNDVLK
jgi:NAD-dependent DNA ligase